MVKQEFYALGITHSRRTSRLANSKAHPIILTSQV
jgi:hypothetical protein